MVNILAKIAYLCHNHNFGAVLFLPHFSRCFATFRDRKFSKHASLRVRIVKLIKIRLLNMKLNEETIIHCYFSEKLPENYQIKGNFRNFWSLVDLIFAPFFSFGEK